MQPHFRQLNVIPCVEERIVSVDAHVVGGREIPDKVNTAPKATAADVN